MFIRSRKTIVFVAFMGVLLLATLAGGNQSEESKPVKIPDNLVAFGSDRVPQYAIIVEKQTQSLYLFSHENKTTREVLRFDCSTGEVPGPKTKSGDSKTPEGVYFFTKEHLKKDLSPIYGTRAYPMDYPNILDRVAGRDGNSIWLHGTNKPLKPRDSNGCVVLENSDIDALAKYITLNQTPIIIVQRLSFDADGFPAPAASAVYTLLKDWTKALQDGTYHDYLSFYDPGYLPDISWWPGWNRLKSGLDDRLPILSEQGSIFRLKDLYVLLFDQSIYSGGAKKPVGRRKLFIRKSGDRYRIIGDEYLAAWDVADTASLESPLLAAYRSLILKTEKETSIKEMIDGWLRAWSAKDIKTYGDYYAKHFRSRGMNRRRWLRYKNRLNRKYAYIKVTAENLKIEKGDSRSIATFMQTYRSPGYRAIGTKKLVLVREDGQWKIFRETWKKR